MKRYAHPFSSCCQKALITLHESAAPFPFPLPTPKDGAKDALLCRLLRLAAKAFGLNAPPQSKVSKPSRIAAPFSPG